MRLRGWILLTWVLVPLAGCASLTDFQYEQTQRSRARAAWHEHGVATMPSAYAHDYRTGWKDGFYDVVTGGKGCPPVVAPCHYWKPSQILEDRDQARHAYYSGFQDGVAAALQYPQTHYLPLWSSCECPLPVCENRCCPTTTCCPTEPCGLIYQDQIQGTEIIVPHHEGTIYPGSGYPGNGDDSVREAVPYQLDADQVLAAPPAPSRTAGYVLPETIPSARVSAEAHDVPRSSAVEEAQPYYFDTRLHGDLMPLDGNPLGLPSRMIDQDRGMISPCNLLQYAN
jgi:hypothetical protein